MTATEITTCPDCGVDPGSLHQEGCDVALCPLTGEQRLQCACDEDHGWGMWKGLLPGEAECREFGWWARWTVVTKYSPDGRPDSGPEERCGADHADAHHDLNRLAIAGMSDELRWDSGLERWVKPE